MNRSKCNRPPLEADEDVDFTVNMTLPASLAAGKIVANYGPRLAAADYPALRDEFFGS